jgi:putative glutamine amidotransferase
MRPLIGIPCYRSIRKRTALFGVKAAYCQALQAAGAVPILIPLLDDDQALLDLYGRLDGLLLSGGGDIAPRHFGERRLTRLIEVSRARDRVELLVTRRAAQDGLPILAICRGVQMLNVALGGTLYQHIDSQVTAVLRHCFYPGFARNHIGHEVLVQAGTRLAGIAGTGALPVNSFHHQAVKGVASALRVSATAPDGVIEAVEAPGERFVLGVQWHPEDLIHDDPRMLRLFQSFVAAAS